MHNSINLIAHCLVFLVAHVQITPSGEPVLGESGYTLTCKVVVASHLCSSTITYQWIKNSSTITRLETPPNSLLFSPLRLSDAGQYAYQSTISSLSLIENVSVIEFHNNILKLQRKLSENSEIADSPSSSLCDTNQ